MSLPEALLVVLLLGLGTARAAAIVAIDEISAPVRDMIFHWYPPADDDENGWHYQCLKPASKEMRAEAAGWGIPWWQKRWDVVDANVETCREPAFLGKLIGCHKCTAVWIAAGNTALYFVWQDAAIVLNVFLAAALVSAVVNKHLYD